MKRITLLCFLFIIALMLISCDKQDVLSDSSDSEQLYETDYTATEQSVEQEEIPYALPPMVLVNDVMYQSYDFRSGVSQILDDTWTRVGEIESSVSLTEKPTENLQANCEFVGTEVYHSSSGRITVNPYGSDIIKNDEEFFGDSIILAYKGEYHQYIAIKEYDKVNELLKAMSDYGMLLQVDGVMYTLRAHGSVGAYKLDDTYVYLGEILSSVPENERPTEDFQVNSLVVEVGSKIYKLPPDHISGCDFVVICGNYGYQYKNMGW